VLTESGVVRSDIRTSFASYSGTASGIESTISLTVLDSANGNAPLAGAAVYLWHADQDGHYSLYTVKDQNYLRGVQVTDAKGTVTFTSIYPACYDGRWPHIHYEVYSSVDDITNAGNKIATSQIALPEDACNLVYATDGYSQSVSNMQRVSLETDNVFSDGWDLELGTVTGSVDTTMAIALTVAV
jgi:protocatechuate 3,4-dioxygenase beta subunit